ncbi:hypothetical protein MKK58_12435 [Methylobacterium sp. J-078]|uniref:hypothetical protein n=1 Tax=Methylobacterium sp. J-078 TaxID=2836657 RepID=UPI001FBB4543|nr:hypothetical protein [Methylobacterium sp. J-078]MCJ2045330.1 hypothetical protein [Methylobacterium sp. J-078]
MTPLATMLWPALAASLLLGAGIGWLAGLPRTGPARWGALALVLGAGLCGALTAAGLVPGRAATWIECAALLLAAYLVGAIAAAGIAQGRGIRP